MHRAANLFMSRGEGKWSSAQSNGSQRNWVEEMQVLRISRAQEFELRCVFNTSSFLIHLYMVIGLNWQRKELTHQNLKFLFWSGDNYLKMTYLPFSICRTGSLAGGSTGTLAALGGWGCTVSRLGWAPPHRSSPWASMGYKLLLVWKQWLHTAQSCRALWYLFYVKAFKQPRHARIKFLDNITYLYIAKRKKFYG